VLPFWEFEEEAVVHPDAGRYLENLRARRGGLFTRTERDPHRSKAKTWRSFTIPRTSLAGRSACVTNSPGCGLRHMAPVALSVRAARFALLAELIE